MSTAARIDVLVVEDDRPLCELLAPAIRRNDLGTDVVGDVVEAKLLLARNQYKVIVLDLMFPDGTGFDVLDFINAEGLKPNIEVAEDDAVHLVLDDRLGVADLRRQFLELADVAVFGL